jgi:hypothetical protein
MNQHFIATDARCHFGAWAFVRAAVACMRAPRGQSLGGGAHHVPGQGVASP